MLARYSITSYLERGVCKGTDRLVCVVHGHGNTTTILKVKDLHPLWLTTLRGVDQLHLSINMKLVYSKTDKG